MMAEWQGGSGLFVSGWNEKTDQVVFFHHHAALGTRTHSPRCAIPGGAPPFGNEVHLAKRRGCLISCVHLKASICLFAHPVCCCDCCCFFHDHPWPHQEKSEKRILLGTYPNGISRMHKGPGSGGSQPTVALELAWYPLGQGRIGKTGLAVALGKILRRILVSVV